MDFLKRAAICVAAPIVPLVWAVGFMLASFQWKSAGSLAYMGGTSIACAIWMRRWR